MKYELKKIIRTRHNKVIWIILFLVTLFLGIMPVRTVSTLKDINSSHVIKGRKAIKLEKERYKHSQGTLTLEKIGAFIDRVNEYPSNEDAYSNLSMEEPAMLKILSYAYGTTDGSYLINAKKTHGKDFYEKNQDQINDSILQNEDNYKNDEKQIILEKAKNLDIPYHMTYAKQWNLLYKSFGLLYIIMALSIIIQTSSVFSYEKEKSMDKILSSSAKNMRQITNNKIKATATFISIQWLIASAILLSIFGINFGFSGFFSQIQIEYFTSIYPLSFGKAVIIEIILGLLTLFAIGLFTIVINACNKNTLKTLLISIFLTCIPVLLLRFPGFSYSIKRFLETLPIFGGNIHRNLLTLNIYKILGIPVLRATKIFVNSLIIIGIIFLILQWKTKPVRRK